MSELEFNLEIRQLIRAALCEQQRSVSWLARNAGIPIASLHRHLSKTPTGFRAFELFSICKVLGWNIRDLFSEVSL